MSAENCFNTPPSPGGHPGQQCTSGGGRRRGSYRESWWMWRAKPVWGTVDSGRLSASRHLLPLDTAGIKPGWARRSMLRWSSWLHWSSQQLEVSREVSQDL